ncbi:MAG: cob(I)yrinic acid a,c-diamide adenosyltransferase [Acidimicrobiia bacterium]|nr:cob(I)yrinic acid a,c-diamide adenosyltransferase [Acidimicrobiia bacterium]
MKIYTKKGDDGTTGLLYGGRVPKDGLRPEAYGTVDELQASIGLARAECEEGGELDMLLVGLERDLWVLMAEVATDPANHAKLTDGASRVTPEMVGALEGHIDAVNERFAMPTEFVVPGQNRVAALLDVGRTVARRAERRVIAIGDPPAQVIPYLNRLSDLLWTLARWQEGDSLPSRGA